MTDVTQLGWKPEELSSGLGCHGQLLAEGYIPARDMPIKLNDVARVVGDFSKTQLNGGIESFVLVPFSLVPDAVPEKAKFASDYLYVVYRKSR